MIDLTYPVTEWDVALGDDVLLGRDGLQLLPVHLGVGHPEGCDPQQGHEDKELEQYFILSYW